MSGATESDTQALNMDAKDVAMVGTNEEGGPEGVDLTVDNGGGGGGAKKVRRHHVRWTRVKN